MDQRQARAVARELNRLEWAHDEAERWVKIFSEEDARQYQKQSCGHERRFIVGTTEGTPWCVLCELYGGEETIDCDAVLEMPKPKRRRFVMTGIEETTDETD